MAQARRSAKPLRWARRWARKARRLWQAGTLWSQLAALLGRWWRRRFDWAKTIKIFDGAKVLTLRECCRLLGVVPPPEYARLGRVYIDQTALFDAVDDASTVAQSMRWVRDVHSQYSLNNERIFKGTQREAASFRRWHDTMLASRPMGIAELLRSYTRWRFVFAPAGYSAENYFTLGLEDRTLDEAQTLFVSTRQAFHFTAFRDRSFIKYFNNKVRFLKTFEAFVGREWLDMRVTSFDAFQEFCGRHREFVKKPITQSQGLGIEVINPPAGQTQLTKLFRELVKSRVLIEEVVHQHPALAEVNASSLNTVRVHTVRRPGGSIDVVTAYVRFGRQGSRVDNFHSFGVAALVDIATGVTTTSGRNLSGDCFDVHPDSGVPLPGFQVPCWHQVVAMAAAAAAVIPQMHHVGWDIAITSDGQAEMIEGNSFPSLSTTLQILDGLRGNIKPVYQKYFDEFDATTPRNSPHAVTPCSPTTGTSRSRPPGRLPRFNAMRQRWP